MVDRDRLKGIFTGTDLIQQNSAGRNRRGSFFAAAALLVVVVVVPLAGLEPARPCGHVLRVARTLADLDASANVRRIHVAEALSYRRIQPGR